MHDSSGFDGDNGGMGSGEQCGKRADSVLDLLSNSYSKLDAIYMDISRPSSCSTLYHLLTTYFINHCLKERVNNFGLRRLLYSKQGLKDAYYSPI